MKVMIVVTHLLGSGHLARALTLARAFRSAGHGVLLASGGNPVPQFDSSGIDLLQLPPLHSDGTNFTTLLDETGDLASPDLLSARTARLEKALHDFCPDILLTELFPFGRRILRDEFLGLLAAAHTLVPRPVILSSIRDILAPPSKPAKAEMADDIIARYYDAVLVHSDPAATRLDHSWPVSDALRPSLCYTGYVAQPDAGPHPDAFGAGEVIVSAGGGAVGTSLFQAAIGAAALSPDQTWHLLVGGRDAAARIAALKDHPLAPNLIIEPARPDFRQILYHAAASVSMCGYNTALDLLQAGTPAVFVPFDDGNETEQGLRATSLQTLGGLSVLPTRDLSPQRLSTAVRDVMAAPRRTDTGLQFDGASQTVQMACDMARCRI